MSPGGAVHIFARAVIFRLGTGATALVMKTKVISAVTSTVFVSASMVALTVPGVMPVCASWSGILSGGRLAAARLM